MASPERPYSDAAGTTLLDLETPCLLLDPDRLARNCARMRARSVALGVRLRPHLKTAKSLDVACIATGGEFSGGVTVSTLKEAEHFARGGYRDVLYATAITPNKFARAARIQRETGADLLLVADSAAMVHAAERFADQNDVVFSFLIEIDCGEHRSGVKAHDPTVAAMACAIDHAPHLRFRGVMTHAGHSYGTNEPETVREIATGEREAAVAAADAIRAAGIGCEIVSVGSTPTALHADHLQGVTELRAGIYMFWDLAQASRNMCREDDIAVSVLASVIGHNRSGRGLILDAGALALSKDIGANTHRPDVGYGAVCDPLTLERFDGLCVNGVHQEHGTVSVGDDTCFERLPIGSLVRVLPNHACITGAAHEEYHVVAGGRVVGRWARVNGW